MNAHTPGTWEAVEHSWSRIGIYAGDRAVAALDIYDEATEESEDALGAEMAANARLIAAAPRMHEYIASSASAGCAEARKILAEIAGDCKDA